MSAFIRRWAAGTASRLHWIDFDAYACAVFAGGTASWTRDPDRRAAVLAQALGVVGSEVVTLDLIAPFLSGRHGVPSGVGADPAACAAALLTADQPAAYIATLIDALAHRLGGRADIALSVPSPRDVLVALGHPAASAPSFDALDDVGMALSDLTRSWSAKPIDALVIRVSDLAAWNADEAEATGAVIAAVQHFGWTVALDAGGSGTRGVAWPPPDGFLETVAADLFLFAEAPAEDLATRSDRRFGGGLGQAFWAGTPDPDALSRWPFTFGTIPPTTRPEEVNVRLSALSAGAV